MKKENQNVFASFLATGFFVGKIAPFAKGTFGSIIGLLLFMAFPLKNILFITIVNILIFLIGYLASKKYTSNCSDTDPSEVVIDEISGQFLCCSIINYYSIIGNAFSSKGIIIYIISFLSFRLFDIVKPLGIKRLEKLKNVPFAIMIDDILAGVYASILTLILRSLINQYIIK